MIELYAEGKRLRVVKRQLLTSGSVGVDYVQFGFSQEWAGITPTAVFQAGETRVNMLLDESGVCVLPWEVLTEPGKLLRVGVYGTQGEDVVLPTLWATIGPVSEGTQAGEESSEHTADAYTKLLALIGNLDGLETEEKTSIVAAVNEIRAFSLGDFQLDETLRYQDGKLAVNCASAAEADNTLPITSAAVHTEVGNIGVLLATI